MLLALKWWKGSDGSRQDVSWTTCSAASSLSAHHLQSSASLLSGSVAAPPAKPLNYAGKMFCLKRLWRIHTGMDVSLPQGGHFPTSAWFSFHLCTYLRLISFILKCYFKEFLREKWESSDPWCDSTLPGPGWGSRAGERRPYLVNVWQAAASRVTGDTTSWVAGRDVGHLWV